MRIALGISYQGTYYHGWQSQHGLITIQSVLEAAIQKVANQPIKLICAGRTDKGVHAVGQIGHFDTTAVRAERAWLLGINSHLPKDIRIQWVRPITDDFHARFSATARTYHYIIENKPLPSALWHQHVTHCYYPLNEKLMQEGANYLLGEHDFSSFRAVACQSNSPMRNIHDIKIIRQGSLVKIMITANAFLHHMVRNIIGVLLQIGSEQHKPIWVQKVLLAKDRTQAGITACPNGLYLYRVTYPINFCLPQSNDYIFV